MPSSHAESSSNAKAQNHRYTALTIVMGNEASKYPVYKFKRKSVPKGKIPPAKGRGHETRKMYGRSDSKYRETC